MTGDGNDNVYGSKDGRPEGAAALFFQCTLRKVDVL